MPQLALHIGGGKTGSSYLQSCFAALRDDLLSQNIFYPDAGRLRFAARGRRTSGNGITFAEFSRWPDKDPEAPGRLQSMLKDADGLHVLISSEKLQFIARQSLKRLHEAADASGYKMRVVYYVRSVAERAWSSYGQRVKSHAETRSFKEWLEAYEYPNGRTCENLAAVLPNDAIIVRNYDHARSNLWSDFAEASGFPVLAAIEPPTFVVYRSPTFVVNRSLSAAEIAYKRVMNHCLTSQAAQVLAGEALGILPVDPEPVIITPEELEILTERCSSQLAAVNRHLPPERHIAILSGKEIIGERPEPEVGINDRMSIQLIAHMLELMTRQGSARP